MKKSLIVVIAILAILGLFVLSLSINIVGTLDKENGVRQLIVAKQEDNKSEMDAMWKTIEQTAQVTQAQKDALVEIFNGYAQNRTQGGGGIMKWIQESVPNVDTSTFNNLQNIITSKRDGFARRQKELLDFSREHNTILGNVWSGFVCRTFGRDKVSVTIVTSTRTEQSFETGKDDNVMLPMGK